MAVSRIPRQQFQADIAVYNADGVRIELLVEVGRDGSETSADQLREAMALVGCHHGLLLTPTLTFVYRDTFSNHGIESIRLRGNPLATPTLLGSAAFGRDLSDEQQLAQAATDWLEQLAAAWYTALPEDQNVYEAFVPALVDDIAQGEVRRSVTI